MMMSSGIPHPSVPMSVGPPSRLMSTGAEVWAAGASRPPPARARVAIDVAMLILRIPNFMTSLSGLGRALAICPRPARLVLRDGIPHERRGVPGAHIDQPLLGHRAVNVLRCVEREV